MCQGNCLFCDFSQCKYDAGRTATGIDWSDLEQKRAYKRDYMRKRRKAKLQAEFPFLKF